MATSGSTNFSQTRNEVILDAFQILGVYGIGRTVSSEDMTFASSMLNKMVKSWITQGLHLWSKEEAVLFTDYNTGEYTLGNASTHAKATNVSDQIITQLNGAHAASATTLTVDSTTNMAVSDFIGVVTSDNTIHWTTIATIPSSTSLTISSGLDSAASDDGLVYTFTSRINKPMRVLACRRRSGYDTTQNEVVLSPVSHEDYFNLPVKTSNGEPVQYYYNPDLTNGILYLWPRPNNGNTRIHFTYERLIEDLDSTSDDFDFPAEWLEPLTYQLAVRLARPFGKPSAIQDLLPLASQMLENLKSWDNEIVSIEMIPDLGCE